MRLATSITRSSLVFVGMVVGVAFTWACSQAGGRQLGGGGRSGGGLVPDAYADTEVSCKSWKVKSFPVGKTTTVSDFELPDGYEPINGNADFAGLIGVIGKKCVAY